MFKDYQRGLMGYNFAPITQDFQNITEKIGEEMEKAKRSNDRERQKELVWAMLFAGLRIGF